MSKSIMRKALLGFLLLGFIVPGAALAGGADKGCSNIGTWFGIAGPDDMTHTGFIASVMGKSNNRGINILEYPNYDPSLGIDEEPFKSAVRITDSHGNWVRTGGNTFDYTFSGFALNAANEPVYISKISGQVLLYGDCQYQYITAILEVFLPFMDPRHDEPIVPPINLGEFYAYRAKVDLPF